ncbi:hypothetical protein B0H13DRAFT_2356566 [Mycena leptocephala]|nr:hypothetical protein B0H13DRAFT_2379976 [Mycena leptocephala]KAJ7858334.1 hypothetical protein B0H13DRAFT_2356566 [Mycena leptocephala]
MYTKRRYHPYPQAHALPHPPAPSPQTKLLLKDAAEQLEFYNSAGVLVTWVKDDWELLARPTRTTANSSQLVGAASFPSPNFVYPSCPHLDAHGSPYAPMILNLNKKIHGAKHDFFRAGDHLCDFAGKISRAQDFLSCPDFISQSLSRKYAQQSTASTPKTTTANPPDSDTEPPAASSSSSSSISATSSPRFDDSPPNDPRVMSSSNTTPASSPIPPRIRKSSTHTSRVSEHAYHARAHSDLSVVKEC